MVSLSNMPLARVEGEGEEWEWDVYQPTVAMSTYLIAFVVSEFHFVEQQVCSEACFKAMWTSMRKTGGFQSLGQRGGCVARRVRRRDCAPSC